MKTRGMADRHWISFQGGIGRYFVNLKQVSRAYITKDHISIIFGPGKDDNLTIRKEEDETCYGKLVGFFSDSSKFSTHQL